MRRLHILKKEIFEFLKWMNWITQREFFKELQDFISEEQKTFYYDQIIQKIIYWKRSLTYNFIHFTCKL